MNETIKKVIAECFWGDYIIDPETAEAGLLSNDKDFIKFFIMRIITESPAASARLKSLFSKEQLEKYLPESSDNKRIDHRIKLVRSVLLRDIPGGVIPWTK